MRQINNNGKKSLNPVPIKDLNGQIIMTDGHTRSLAHFLLGKNDIEVIWENEDLDWEVYQVCVNWCHDNDIYSVKDLKGRIIDNEEYEIKWIQRCQTLKIQLQNN